MKYVERVSGVGNVGLTGGKSEKGLTRAWSVGTPCAELAPLWTAQLDGGRGDVIRQIIRSEGTAFENGV